MNEKSFFSEYKKNLSFQDKQREDNDNNKNNF
jgi:hypothetical protein